jgi:hypothetical protein
LGHADGEPAAIDNPILSSTSATEEAVVAVGADQGRSCGCCACVCAVALVSVVEIVAIVTTVPIITLVSIAAVVVVLLCSGHCHGRRVVGDAARRSSTTTSALPRRACTA